MAILLLCFWSAQTTAAQIQFHLGIVPPSDTRLLAPTTAASIIQHSYRRHGRQADIRVAATRIQGWFCSAILGVHAAAHRQVASAIPAYQRANPFDQRANPFNQRQIPPAFLAQTRAEAAAWQLESAQFRAKMAAWKLKFAELDQQLAINNDIIFVGIQS